jgi:hypothetical protein
MSFCQGPASDQNPPTIASYVATITNMNHHSQLVYWDGGLANFLVWSWPGTIILLISTSWVVGIIGVSQNTYWPFSFLSNKYLYLFYNFTFSWISFCILPFLVSFVRSFFPSHSLNININISPCLLHQFSENFAIHTQEVTSATFMGANTTYTLYF